MCTIQDMNIKHNCFLNYYQWELKYFMISNSLGDCKFERKQKIPNDITQTNQSTIITKTKVKYYIIKN